MPPLSKRPSTPSGNFTPDKCLHVMQKIFPFLHDALRCLEKPLLFSETHFMKTLMTVKFDCEQVLDILKKNSVCFPELKVNLEIIRISTDPEVVVEEDESARECTVPEESGDHEQPSYRDEDDDDGGVSFAEAAPNVEIGAFNDDDPNVQRVVEAGVQTKIESDCYVANARLEPGEIYVDDDVIKEEIEGPLIDVDVKSEPGVGEETSKEPDANETMEGGFDDDDDAISCNEEIRLDDTEPTTEGRTDDDWSADEEARKDHCTLIRRPNNKIRFMCRICRCIYPFTCGENTASPTAAEIVAHEAGRKCQESQMRDKCEECESLGIDFSDIKLRLRRHIRAHMAPFHCKKCELTFDDLHEMRIHVKTHLGKYLRCRRCNRGFTDLETLKAHYPKKHGGAQYQRRPGASSCFLCFKDVSPSLMHHHLTQHLKIGYSLEKKPLHKCPSCDFQARLYHAVVRHQKVHVLPYLCRKCDFKAESTEEFKEHCQDKHSNDRKIVCKLCDKSFSSKDVLLTHIDSHDRKKDEEEQSRGLKWKPLLLRYGSLKCFVCDEEVFRLKYNRHIRTHIRFQGNPYKCKLCPAEFDRRSYLTAHTEAVHERVRRYHCHACSFSSYSNPNLNHHIRTKHEAGSKEGPKKLYPCPIPRCHKSFNHKETYDQHLALHSKKRKKPRSTYHCSTCNMGFSRVTNLYRHAYTHRHPVPNQDLKKFYEPKPKKPAGEKLKKNGEKYSKKRNRKWTRDEDDWICAGVRELGKGCWKEILEKYKEHFHDSRDRFTIRLRYAYLEKRGFVEKGVLKPDHQVVDGRKNNGGFRLCLKEVDLRKFNSGICRKDFDMRKFNGGPRKCMKEVDMRKFNGGSPYRGRRKDKDGSDDDDDNDDDDGGKTGNDDLESSDGYTLPSSPISQPSPTTTTTTQESSDSSSRLREPQILSQPFGQEMFSPSPSLGLQPSQSSASQIPETTNHDQNSQSLLELL